MFYLNPSYNLTTTLLELGNWLGFLQFEIPKKGWKTVRKYVPYKTFLGNISGEGFDGKWEFAYRDYENRRETLFSFVGKVCDMASCVQPIWKGRVCRESCIVNLEGCYLSRSLQIWNFIVELRDFVLVHLIQNMAYHTVYIQGRIQSKHQGSFSSSFFFLKNGVQPPSCLRPCIHSFGQKIWLVSAAHHIYCF